MGFFSSIGKAIGSVGKVVGSVAQKAASVGGGVFHSVASAVPLVKDVYSLATNIAGVDAREVFNLAGNIAGGVLKDGIQGIKDAPGKVKDAIMSSGIAQNIHEGLQMNNNKAGFEATENLDNKTLSYSGVPTYDGIALTATNSEASYDTNPLALPVVVKSGGTNTQLINAISPFVDPKAVQTALTGVQPKGKVNLESILDFVTGTSNAAKDSFVAKQEETSTTNKYLLFGGAGALLLALFYFINKK